MLSFRKLFQSLVIMGFIVLPALQLGAEDAIRPSVPAVSFVVEAFNSGNTSGIENYVAEDVVFRSLGSPGENAEGVAGFANWISTLCTAMPDIEMQVYNEVVGTDMVAIRWTAEGMHQGDVPGMPASGNKIYLRGMSLAHLTDGKIDAWWHVYDNLTFMVQTGILPSPWSGLDH